MLHSSIYYPIIFVAFTCSLLCSCSESKEKEVSGPIVGVMELPVTLRSNSPEPQNAHKIEIAYTQLNLNGQALFELEKGRISESEYQNGSLPKLQSALNRPQRSTLDIEVYSGVPYETLYALLNSAYKAGTRNAVFKVRGQPNSPETGWLAINGYKVADSADGEISFENVVPRPWTDFVNVWEEVTNACFTQKYHVSCVEKPIKVSQKGRLQISLSAIGRGMTLKFHQVGVEIPQDEEALAQSDERELTREQIIAAKAKKEDEKESGPVKWADGEEFPIPDGLDDELTKEFKRLPPARQAAFQFRGSEAVNLPSPVTGTMAPICGNVTCGVLIEGRKSTATFRILTMIGAAFPAGTPAPSIAFVRPPK